MGRFGVVICLLAVPQVARAEPGHCGPGAYDELYGWIGATTTSIPSVGVRNALGYVHDVCPDDESVFQLRVGGLIEGIKRESLSGGEVTLGIELEANWLLPGSTWRAGPHGIWGTAKVEPGQATGVYYVDVGARVRSGFVSIGVDVIHATASSEPLSEPKRETLVAVGAGISPTGRKPLLITLGIAAGVVLTGVIIAAYAAR